MRKPNGDRYGDVKSIETYYNVSTVRINKKPLRCIVTYLSKIHLNNSNKENLKHAIIIIK
jgi:hypothetical protein